MDKVIEAYESAAPKLIDRFNAIHSPDLFKPVIDLFPQHSCRVLDIGAGPGRDAAWLASLGHTVLAVEPVKEFRDAGLARYPTSKIDWVDDRLPELTETKRYGRFDLVLLSAVWHHLDEGQRRVAMRNIADLTTPGGVVIMSLRHGPGAAERTVYPIVPEETIEMARGEGFTLLRRVEAESVQAANQVSGVHWTWLVLARQ